MFERVSTTGNTESEHRAIERFLTARTVPLCYEKDGRAFVHGTGAFFRTRGELLLVTAAHVLQGIDPAEIGVPEQPFGNTSVWLLSDITIHHPKAFDTFDIAIVEFLNPNFHRRVAANWQFVDESEVIDTTEVEESYVVAGYPSESVEDRNGTLTPKPMLQLFTKPHEAVSGESVPEHDLLLKYGKTATGIFGAQRATPKLEGVSGALVYGVVQPGSDIWSPEQALKPVGIQVSYKPGSYLRVKKWSLISRLIQIAREQRDAN